MHALAVLALGQDREEVVMLSEVSETGLRLHHKRSASVALEELLHATIIMRVSSKGNIRALRLNARLVRVANVTDTTAELAFSLHDLTKEDAEVLWSVKHLLFTP